MTAKKKLTRWVVYIIGMIILALGLSLNTQVNLGVATIISVSETYHLITGVDKADATLYLFILLVIIQVIVHLIRKQYKAIITDVLQVPLSIVFTRFMKLYFYIIPDFKVDMAGSWLGSVPARLFFLMIAIICTGIGAATTLNMRLVPNPGDGMVQTVADCIGKGVGFSKNCVDLCCVCISCIMGLIFLGGIPSSVNIGTLCAMLLTGRVIYFFNKLTREKMLRATGMDQQ
ncbi:MAG: hypothetical protein MJ075_01845 [Oscillospiraceae bacterium]|nr:hypothetical protein [Oscillospiraceae bacterium]